MFVPQRAGDTDLDELIAGVVVVLVVRIVGHCATRAKDVATTKRSRSRRTHERDERERCANEMDEAAAANPATERRRPYLPHQAGTRPAGGAADLGTAPFPTQS